MRLFRRSALLFLAFVGLLALTSSCSVREELIIDGDGAGEATISVNLSPVLLAYYNDLLIAMTGVEGESPVFDVDQIRASFAERDGIELTSVERPARGRLRMSFTFDDVNEVLARESGTAAAQGAPVDPSEVIQFRSNGARREVIVRLDRSAVDSFLSFAPPESATMTEFLFPPADGSVSEREYRDELAWALEEYAPPDEVNELLRSASIDVWVRPEGRIESQRGGTIRDGAVVFSVPILEVLTLSRVREYLLVFVP